MMRALSQTIIVKGTLEQPARLRPRRRDPCVVRVPAARLRPALVAAKDVAASSASERSLRVYGITHALSLGDDKENSRQTKVVFFAIQFQ